MKRHAPRRLAATAALLGGLAFLAGCGGSGRQLSHAATHRYSVRQVERAFAAQGIHMRNVSPRAYRGSLALLDGRPAHSVYAYVETGKFTGALKPAIRKANVTRHGNVEVLWQRGERSAVRAALLRLN